MDTRLYQQLIIKLLGNDRHITPFPGHFLLTNLLLDKMKHTARNTGIEGRIVNLSSVAHSYTYKDGIQFDNLNDKMR